MDLMDQDMLTTAKTQIIINGMVGKEIPLRRGLR